MIIPPMPPPPPTPPPTGYACDICDGSMSQGQGYGLRGARSASLQYCKDLNLASKHICNGCLIALCWIFDDSVGNRMISRQLRFDPDTNTTTQ